MNTCLLTRFVIALKSQIMCHPLPAVHDCLLSMLAAALPLWGSSPSTSKATTSSWHSVSSSWYSILKWLRVATNCICQVWSERARTTSRRRRMCGSPCCCNTAAPCSPQCARQALASFHASGTAQTELSPPSATTTLQLRGRNGFRKTCLGSFEGRVPLRETARLLC
jgi:hypothetical protein